MSVAKRPNGKWRARVRLPDGSQRAKHFDRKIDAERWAALQVVRLGDGTWVDPMRGRRTFGDYAAQWIDAQVHHRASTRETTARRLQLHLLPRFGDMPLASIQRSDVQGWVKHLAETLAPAYVEGLYRLLAQVLLAAVDDGVIGTSPCGRGKVKLPERVRSSLVVPTVADVAALVAHAPPHAAPLVLTAAGTGMRVGELAGLTVDRVDFLRRQVRVDRQLKMGGGVGMELGPVKTRSSNRTIPIAAHLAGRPPGAGALLFVNGHGRPWLRTSLEAEWARWRRRAGVEIRPHDLRHFYASSLIAAGQSVKVIQARLGHATAQETLDTYGHLWHDDEDRTRTITADVLRAVLGTAPAQGGDSSGTAGA